MSKESLYNLNWRIFNAVLQDWKAAFPASAEQFMKKRNKFIHPFTVGHMNRLFSDSAEGLVGSTITYTMVEISKAHGSLQYFVQNYP